jgi:ribosomal protein L16/L10AE
MSDGRFCVKIDFKTRKRHMITAHNIEDARDIAGRTVTEGAWLTFPGGIEEYYPITEIHKVKIIPLEEAKEDAEVGK